MIHEGNDKQKHIYENHDGEKLTVEDGIGIRVFVI
jgi:hypothetical protein